MEEGAGVGRACLSVRDLIGLTPQGHWLSQEDNQSQRVFPRFLLGIHYVLGHFGQQH
jgi:hypothetical protein